MNPTGVKEMGVTHEKMGNWPQKPYFNEVLGVECPFFSLKSWTIFRGNDKFINESKQRKKMGVTHEKMGIWPQKPYISKVFGVKRP